MDRRPSAAIVTIGNEITEGRIRDSNGEVLSAFLHSMGFDCRYILSCQDDLEDILEVFKFLKTSTDCIIVTGGLGPTSDDLTREAIATYCNKKLSLFESELRVLKEKYTARGREFDPINEKQALFPESSKIIENNLGTANGFWLAEDSKIIISLPGVPVELELMLEKGVREVLDLHFKSISPSALQIFKVFGRAESSVGREISLLPEAKEFQLGYRASFPELEVRIRKLDGKLDDNFLSKIGEILGRDYIFSETEKDSLPNRCHRLLVDSQKTLSLAESCTGGLATHLLSQYAGASNYLMGSAVTYSNQSKNSMLGVDLKTLDNFGAVSHETASEMACKIRECFNSELAISVTGIAGPNGATAQKPIGTFYIGLADQQSCTTFRYFFSHERAFVQGYAAHCMLDTIRRYLLNLPDRKDSCLQEIRRA